MTSNIRIVNFNLLKVFDAVMEEKNRGDSHAY